MSVEGSILLNSSFKSFADFEQTFTTWCKDTGFQFRIGSSETLKGSRNLQVQFKYRYVVYHCVHFGEPRVRGLGKRPNQSYLSCGCKAQVRLNYIEKSNCLKVMKFKPEHTGHGADSQKESYRYASSFVTMPQVANKIDYSDAGENTKEYFDKLIDMQKLYVEGMRKENRKYRKILNENREETGLNKFYPLPIVAETVDFFTKIMVNKATFSAADQEEFEDLEEKLYNEYSE